MEKRIKVYFPRWASIIYAILAVILVPWIFNLAQSLPSRHLARHWDAVWVGFDSLMFLTIILTLWFVLKRLVWVVVSASALAALFIVDAWFDILTARPGSEQRQALFFGIVEISFALLTLRLIYLVVHHSAPEKNIKLAIDKRDS